MSPTACHPQHVIHIPQFERLANRQHLMKCVGAMHAYVREGDNKAEKLRLFRNMGGDFETDQSKEMACHIVEVLLTIAKGRDPATEKKRGFYPYTKKAAESTAAFKATPFPSFALSLTALYPFIVREKDKWPELMKKYLHPMSATGLWPVATLNRYLSFFSLFRANRDKLFKCYESQGGKYHGAESRVALAPSEVVTDFTTLSSSDEDSVDADFM